jgi:tetratricopeptide (TPR) repeat protein
VLQDAQGLKVTTHAQTAIAQINQFIAASLRYGREAESAILAAIAADPSCAIAHAYAAAYYLSQENAIARQQATPFLAAAQSLAAMSTEREQLYIHAILAWSKGAIDAAVHLHERLARQFPQDLISVQQGQYHYFYQGNKRGLVHIAEAVLPANRHQPELLSMLAFGLEQCHQLRKAEAIGRQATEMNRNNPWAHHAVAHVMEMQGRAAEGIAWMESLSDTWAQCNSMLYTHNWWHVALFYLKEQAYSTVLSLYDRQVWGGASPDSPKDQVGAISLLLRLELAGVMVGDRWQALVPFLSARLHEHALPFQDLHYIYALARAEQRESVQEMLLSMTHHAQRLEPNLRKTWTDLAIPTAQGLVAYAQRDWQQAIAQLKPVLPRLWAVGGSHAQRQIFHQLYQDAIRRDRQAVSTRRSQISTNVMPSFAST